MSQSQPTYHIENASTVLQTYSEQQLKIARELVDTQPATVYIAGLELSTNDMNNIIAAAFTDTDCAIPNVDRPTEIAKQFIESTLKHSDNTTDTHSITIDNNRLTPEEIQEALQSFLSIDNPTSGDVVFDRKASPEDRNPMRIVDPHAETLSNATDDEGNRIEEYEKNKEYDPNTPVAECVYEDQLDNLVVNWQDTLDEDQFSEDLESYCEDWQISIDKYYYPLPRLTE